MVTVAAASMAAAVGCGSNVAVDDDGDDVGGGGGTGGTGNTGNGGSGAKGGECSAFHDQESPDTVTVRIVNDTGLDLYLPAYCDRLAYHIDATDGQGGDLMYTFDASCRYACELAQTEDMFGCPAAACAQTSYLVAPGSSLEVEWAGTGLDSDIQMPAACYFDPAQTSTCSQILAAPEGSYRASIIGSSQCESDAQGPCNCDENGLCFGWPTGLVGYAEPAEFSFPADGEVEIVFGPCAFGCAG
jgi:hypothetical protein